jgi:hypothetical protein
MSQICMPSNHFLLVVLACIGVIGWALYQVNQQAQQIHRLSAEQSNSTGLDGLDDLINQKFKDIENQSRQDNEKSSRRDQERDGIISQLLVANATQRDQDAQRMANPFIPPLQRGPFSPMLATKTLPINIPTHGEYGNFQDLGYAYKQNNPDQMFQLFGRRIHSNKYEYYAIHPITRIKIPIKVKNDWELNRDDRIVLKGFPGDFKVEIYDLDQPRYVPY